MTVAVDVVGATDPSLTVSGEEFAFLIHDFATERAVEILSWLSVVCAGLKWSSEELRIQDAGGL